MLLNGLECISIICFDVQIVPGLFLSLHADFCGFFCFCFFLSWMCPHHSLSTSSLFGTRSSRLISTFCAPVLESAKSLRSPGSFQRRNQDLSLEWSLLLGYHYSNALLVSELGNICTYMFTYIYTCLPISFPLSICLYLCLSVCWNPGFILIVPILI